MNRNVQTVLTALIIFSLSLLIFSVYSAKVEAQTSRGVVTIAFDDGFQSQYYNAYPLMQARGSSWYVLHFF